QFAGEVHGEAAISNDDRGNRRFAGRRVDTTNVESQATQLFFPIASVFPKLLHALGLLLENVERGDAGGGNGWRMQGGKKERSGAVVEALDQVTRAAHITAQRSDGLGQSSHLYIDASMNVEMIDRASPRSSEHT